MNVRQYRFYEGNKWVDQLQITFQSENIQVENQDKKIVSLANIWINGFPATHLKKLNASYFPDTETDHQKQSGHYHLRSKNWQKQIPLKYRWNEIEATVDVVPNLEIKGLKILLEKLLGSLSGGEQYLIFWKHFQLEELLTIEDYKLENETIDVATSTILSEGAATLQRATLLNKCSSLQHFQNYVKQVDEKNQIVCLITIPKETQKLSTGTGFLIHEYLLMTNEHVLVNGKSEGGIAKFFFNDATCPTLEIPLHAEPICTSKSPGQNRPATSHTLDYAILRLAPPSNMTLEQLHALSKIGIIAKSFFETAIEKERIAAEKKPLQEGIKFRESMRRRATIIQHPKEGNYNLPKQIAFRDNRIYRTNGICLHYQSATGEGSSGSPVFNDEGEWIGLHFGTCFDIEYLLFEHRRKLCELLEYTFDPEQSDHTAECYTKNETTLYIQLEGIAKRGWAPTKSGEKSTLKSLIENNHSSLSEILRALGKEDKEEYHTCNTAIDVARILSDLGRYQEAIIRAQNESKNEWAAFALSLQPSKLAQITTVCLVAIPILAIVWFLAKRRQ